ncbi:MAG TPA: hypothetical protein VNG95_04210 [Gemmatimonadales bacterium]|nr:hypothetical protein [Gemmatimonadales bacterium]
MVATGARAQGPPGREAGVGVTAVWARHPFYGLELGVARRPAGQARFSFTAAGGVFDRRPAGRFGAEAQFLVVPAARAGVSVYGGLGVAIAVARDTRGAGYLTATLGVEGPEGRPGGGWYLESGVAGGLRLAFGWRWRRLPSWWS